LIAAFAGPGAASIFITTVVVAFGLAVILERGWYLWLRCGLDIVSTRERLLSGDVDGALAGVGSHPVGRLISAGRSAGSSEAAWDAMGTEASLVESDVRARVGYLAAIGNVATMLGLLGTVYGLIFAFSGLDSASAVERTARLSEGIGAAMTTTAWGLVVGIPALAFHAVLEGRVRRVLAGCESVAAAVALSCRQSSRADEDGIH